MDNTNKYYYLYMIICTAGSFKGKFYIGQRMTRKLPESDSYKGSGKLLRDYFKKYPDDYVKIILSEYNTPEELDRAEWLAVELHRGIDDRCLNLVMGGKGVQREKTGRHLSEETKQKLSESHKGKKHPAWNKGLKGVVYRKGFHLSEETKRKISIAQKDKTLPEWHKQKLLAAHKGKHWKLVNGKRVWYEKL